MANKQDVLKALEIRFYQRQKEVSDKEEALDVKRAKDNLIRMEAYCKKMGYTLKGGVVSKKINGLVFTLDSAGREKLRKRAGCTPGKSYNKWSCEKRREVERQYNEIRRQILLHGISPELLELVEGF